MTGYMNTTNYYNLIYNKYNIITLLNTGILITTRFYI